MSERILWGQMLAAGTAAYWRSGASTSDNGGTIACRAQPNSLYAEGPGGENVFREIAVTIRHTCGGTLKFEPVVNDQVLPTWTATLGGVVYLIETLAATVVLPQQAADAEPRVAEVYVPLVRRLLVNGVEYARWYLRGERFAIRVTPVGVLGQGSLQLDGVAVEARPMQRTDWTQGAAGVNAGTGGS